MNLDFALLLTTLHQAYDEWLTLQLDWPHSTCRLLISCSGNFPEYLGYHLMHFHLFCNDWPNWHGKCLHRTWGLLWPSFLTPLSLLNMANNIWLLFIILGMSVQYYMADDLIVNMTYNSLPGIFAKYLEFFSTRFHQSWFEWSIKHNVG